MDKKIIYVIGFVGALASIASLLFMFTPKNESGNNINQTQSGTGNMLAGRDIVVQNNQSPRSEGVPKYEGEIKSRDSSFVDFADKNDGKVVYIRAYISTIDSQIDTGNFTGSDGKLTNEFHYYYQCGSDLPNNLASQEKESWDWRMYCNGAEIHIGDPAGTDSIWGYRSGMYELKGYWGLSIPGTAMGAIVVRLSPVNIKDAY